MGAEQYAIGSSYTVTRTITREDIRAFADASGDRGEHHLGERPMVHGLLTASLATELGGSLNFIARTMFFEFVAPVFADDTISCVATVSAVEPAERKTRLSFDFEYRNQNGEVVLLGSSSGIIRHESSGKS